MVKVQNTGLCYASNSIHLPTCKTLSTQPISSNFNPLQNERFWGSPPLEFTGVTRDKDEYMHMSLSFLGNDQKMILRWTGSGILSYRSSILWKGIFSATILAVISNKVSGVDRALPPTPAAAVEVRATQHDRLATVTAIDDALSLTEWSSALRSVNAEETEVCEELATNACAAATADSTPASVRAFLVCLCRTHGRKVPNVCGKEGGVYVHMMGRLKSIEFEKSIDCQGSYLLYFNCSEQSTQLVKDDLILIPLIFIYNISIQCRSQKAQKTEAIKYIFIIFIYNEISLSGYLS